MDRVFFEGIRCFYSRQEVGPKSISHPRAQAELGSFLGVLAKQQNSAS